MNAESTVTRLKPNGHAAPFPDISSSRPNQTTEETAEMPARSTKPEYEINKAQFAIYIAGLVLVAGITFGGMKWQAANSAGDHDDFIRFKQEVETKMSYDAKFDKMMEKMDRMIQLQEEQIKLSTYNAGAVDGRKGRR